MIKSRKTTPAKPKLAKKINIATIAEFSNADEKEGIGFRGRDLVYYNNREVRIVDLPQSMAVFWRLETMHAEGLYPDGTRDPEAFLKWLGMVGGVHAEVKPRVKTHVRVLVDLILSPQDYGVFSEISASCDCTVDEAAKRFLESAEWGDALCEYSSRLADAAQKS